MIALRLARSGWGHCYERVRSPASLVVRIGKLRTLAFVPTSAQKSCDTIILRTNVSEAAVKPWPMPNSTLTGSALSLPAERFEVAQLAVIRVVFKRGCPTFGEIVGHSGSRREIQ